MVQLAALRRQQQPSDGWSLRLFQLSRGSDHRSPSPSKRKNHDCRQNKEDGKGNNSEPFNSPPSNSKSALKRNEGGLDAVDAIPESEPHGLPNLLRKDSLLEEAPPPFFPLGDGSRRTFRRFDSTDSMLDSTGSINSFATATTGVSSIAEEGSFLEDDDDDNDDNTSQGPTKKKAERRRSSLKNTEALSSRSKRSPRHRVQFDRVTVHFHSFALANTDVIPVHFRVGDGPFLMTGSWLETSEFPTLEDYQDYRNSPFSLTRRSGSSRSLVGKDNGKKKKLAPLRVYARERVLQKCGVSVREMDQTTAEFSRIRNGKDTSPSSKASSEAKKSSSANSGTKKKKWSFL